jgi:D-arabinose 1-dehydrogenase-like Zn-dependent alcohol dehydrogenase
VPSAEGICTQRLTTKQSADTVELVPVTPLKCRWNADGQRVGVIGLGGLGHMAVKLAAARRADVTVFTTSPGKVKDARARRRPCCGATPTR